MLNIEKSEIISDFEPFLLNWQDKAKAGKRPGWVMVVGLVGLAIGCSGWSTPTEKSHLIHMWPTRESHVFTCVPHVLFQFHTFAHMW